MSVENNNETHETEHLLRRIYCFAGEIVGSVGQWATFRVEMAPRLRPEASEDAP